MTFPSTVNHNVLWAFLLPLFGFGDAYKYSIAKKYVNGIRVYMKPYPMALDDEELSVPVHEWLIMVELFEAATILWMFSSMKKPPKVEEIVPSLI